MKYDLKEKTTSSKLTFSTGDNVSRFQDFLTLDQIDQLISRSEKNHQKRYPFSLRTRYLEMLSPLEPKAGKSLVQHIRVKLKKSRDLKEAFEALLWCAIYGSKHFTVLIWYLLFNIFCKTISDNKQSEALLKILRITTTSRSEGSDLRTHLKPVRTILVQCLQDNDRAVKYCKILEKDLGIKLPTKIKPLTDYFEITYPLKVQKKSPEPSRIGVGYKDKGTLPKEPKQDPIPDESYNLPENDIFVDLLARTKEVLAFSESYDSKKREKLLKKVIDQLKDLG